MLRSTVKIFRSLPGSSEQGPAPATPEMSVFSRPFGAVTVRFGATPAVQGASHRRQFSADSGRS